MPAVLYTTFALINAEVPSAIIDAIKVNLENQSVSKIVILTESSLGDVISACDEFADKKIKLIQVERRPTFKDMFEAINREGLASSVLSVLLNSDISIPDRRTIHRLQSSIDFASEIYGKVALSLTRHDRVNNELVITLKSGMGLPNVLSSDAWVFNSKIECEKDLYYSLGSMYCDKFINHDLIESGYKLFNPCLDCVLIHNEEDVKDAGYYSSLGGEKESKESIQKHLRSSVKKGGNYYGLSRMTSNSITAGYLPCPISYLPNRKRLFVIFGNEQSGIDKYIDVVVNNSRKALGNELDIFFVTDNNDQQNRIDDVICQLRMNSNIYNYFVDSVDTVIESLFIGIHDTYESIGYTDHASYVTAEFVGLSGTVFLDMRNNDQGEISRLFSLSVLDHGIWHRLLHIMRRLLPLKSGAPVNVHRASSSLLVTVYGAMVKEKLLDILSNKEMKSVLFCTSERAQYLKKKYGIG